MRSIKVRFLYSTEFKVPDFYTDHDILVCAAHEITMGSGIVDKYKIEDIEEEDIVEEDMKDNN